jgi:membrane associated rhomboid family serine protease
MIPLRDDQPIFSTPFVNYFLIVLNVVVFLWELSVGMQSHRALNSFLGEFGVVPHHTLAVLTGHSYDGLATVVLPLFTSMFLHASFLHVAGNMLFLWIFGDNIEDYLGHFTYLVFYLVSGVAAGATHILLNQASRVPSVGASGAIAGASADLVSADISVPCSGLADARLLVRGKFPERHCYCDRRNQPDFGRDRFLGACGRLRRGCRDD